MGLDTQVNNNLTALLYHKILPSQLLDADTISIKKFNGQMNYLSENALNAVTIGEIINSTNPSDRDIAIAFDDGYENVYKYALPVLKMYNFKALRCYNCKSIILNLPEIELYKLDGLNFQCECCGHQNLLTELKFNKATRLDPYLNIFSIENFI